MGRHDHQCQACSERFEAMRIEGVVCPRCSSSDTKWLPSMMITSFKKFYHPHLGHEPVEIESMRHLDQELEKRNLYIPEDKVKRAFKPDSRPLPATRKEAELYG